MGKFSNQSVINTNVTPVVPALDPNQALQRSLPSQGMVVPDTTLEYARQAAQQEVPRNPQFEQSPNQGYMEDVPYSGATDESNYRDEPTNRYPNQGEPQLDITDSKGMPLTYEQAQAKQAQTMQLQSDRAKGVGYDWTSEQELKAALPRGASMYTTDRQKLVDTARDVGMELNSMQAEIGSTNPGSPASTKVSALTNLKQGYGLSSNQAATMATTAFALMAPVLSGASTLVEGAIEDQTSSELSAWAAADGDDDVSTVPMMAKAGGLTQDTIDGMLGNTINKLNKRKNVDSEGYATVPRTNNISSKVAGATARQAFVNAGILNEDIVDGQKIYRLSPGKGIDFYRASRMMAQDVTDMGRGRSQTVPVTTTGRYVGAAENLREGDKQKPGYSEVPVVREAMRIAGSIGLLVSPIKSYFAALLGGHAIANAYKKDTSSTEAPTPGGSPGDKVAPVIPGLSDTRKLFGIGEDEIPQSLKQKATVLLKLSNYNGQNILEESPRYAKSWEDYSVHRIYNDTEDVNVQRDLPTRAVVGGVVTPMSITSTSFHKNGISKFEAGKHVGAIRNQVDNGNFKLTDVQREVAWLATLGKVLDVGRTVGRETDSLTLNDQISLVTPEFIHQAAIIGEQLASIVPQSNRAIVGAALNPQSIPASLTPQQLDVLNKFIAGSTKKNWGSRLQAYLDAANYLNAKKNGTAFTPRVTVEIDMNSAGRMFLAADGMNLDVLKRTGILWQMVSDDNLQNTQPYGNPRFMFMKVASEQGVDKAISKDNPDRIAAWKQVLTDNHDKDAADAFAKGVLLTTDYGMAASYHFDDARKFLSKYSNIKNQLLPFYDGKESDLVRDLNHIYGATIRAVVDPMMMSVPKNVVSILQMTNRLPKAEGYWGEQLSIGSMMPKETGEYTTLRDKYGNTETIKHTKLELDPNAAARPKKVHDEETGEEKDHTPPPLSAAKNQVGPAMGQYRESVLVAETMKYINGGKVPKDMLFMQPVFDNLVLNSDSYIQTLHVANNIILPKVMGWDIQKALGDDFHKQIVEARKEILGKKEVDIGVKGEYAGTTHAIDLELSYIEKNIAEGKYVTPEQMSFREFARSPSSGYQVASADRPDNIIIPSEKMMALVGKYYNLKMFKYSTSKEGARYISKEGGDLLEAWKALGRESKGKLLAEIKARAKRGLIYFMN